MSLDAKITVAGSVGQDPTLAYTQGGIAYCKFTVAARESTKVNDRWEDREDGPTWLDVTVWRDMAEHVAESINKGDRVLVQGTLTLDVWHKDGEKRSRHTVTADEVGLSLRFAQAKAERKPKGDAGGSQRSGGFSAPPPPDDVPFFHSYGGRR